MLSIVTRGFVIGAVVLGGLLAGMAADKAVVQLPAWRQLEPATWRRFTLEADLGRGLVLYPAQGIAALLCSVVAAITFRFDRGAPGGAALPIYLAAALAIAGLLVTVRAVAPELLTLRQTGQDPTAVRTALDGVTGWWSIKAALHVATFGANVWSLVALSGAAK